MTLLGEYVEKELFVDVPTQTLKLLINKHVNKDYPISTAANGVGEMMHSQKTPRGLHVVRAKIGAGCELNTVFKARRPTGEIFDESLHKKFPDRDWILTRIIWLSGLEKGRNRLGNCDTMRRYIYIHGVPDNRKMGIPGSKGCINMTNQDIVELFDLISCGTKVFING